MKKLFLLTLLVALVLTAYAEALEYNIEPPAGANYGKATSIEVVHTRDNGEWKNTDISKNAALIPPGFGTPTADLPGSGDYLTPNLAPEAKAGTGAVINGSMSVTVVLPPASGSAVFAPSGGGTAVPPSSGSGESVYQPGSSSLTTTTKPTVTDAAAFTEVTDARNYPRLFPNSHRTVIGGSLYEQRSCWAKWGCTWKFRLLGPAKSIRLHWHRNAADV